MKIWLVWIRYADSIEKGGRWIDSMWADISHARDRTVEIRDSLKACGAIRHEVEYLAATVADCVAVQSTESPQQQNDGTQGGQS